MTINDDSPRVHGRRAKRKSDSSRPSAVGAFGWSLANNVVSRLGTLAIGIVLARLLGPEQFGTFAVALVALMAVLSFNELGVSLAIVRWPGDPARIVGTVNTISVSASAVFCAAAWMAAPAYAHAMGSPEATDVVRLLILSVLLNGIAAGPAALLQRNFRERTRMYIDVTNLWSGTVLSLILALLGWGAMSLAAGRIFGSLLAVILFLRASPLPYRLEWNRVHARALLRFGIPLAGTSCIVFAVGYADQLTVGALLGAVSLGFYVLAFNLSTWPVSLVSQPLRRVGPALFSVLQHDRDRLQDVTLRLLSLIAGVLSPAFLALAGAAVPAVRLIYGEPWVPAAAALSWLVVAALVKVFCDFIYDLIVVMGRTGIVFWIQCVSLLVLVPALSIGGLTAGIAGVAAAQAMVSLVVVLPLYMWQLQHVGIPATEVMSRLGTPALVGVATGAAVWGLTVLMPHQTVLPLVLGVILTLGVMIAMGLRHRDTISLLRTVVRPDPVVESA